MREKKRDQTKLEVTTATTTTTIFRRSFRKPNFLLQRSTYMSQKVFKFPGYFNFHLFQKLKSQLKLWKSMKRKNVEWENKRKTNNFFYCTNCLSYLSKYILYGEHHFQFWTRAHKTNEYLMDNFFFYTKRIIYKNKNYILRWLMNSRIVGRL